MNIVGVGIDAIKVERFKKAVEERGDLFLKKIFTENELEHGGTKKAYYTHMAGKFAAKEELKKAIPEGASIGLNWKEIEIRNDADGKPYTVLHGEAARLAKKFNISKMLISISHTKDLALSNAVGESNGT